MLILSFSGIIDWWITFLVISLPATMLVMLYTVWLPFRQAPAKIGFSSEGLHSQYPKRDFAKVQPRFVAWNDIVEMDIKGGASEFYGVPILKSGKNRKYIIFMKNTGFNFLLGPIDDKIYDEICLRKRTNS